MKNLMPKSSYIIIFILASFSRLVFAEPSEGASAKAPSACWSDPLNVYVVTLTSGTFTTTKAGGSATYIWDDPGTYTGICEGGVGGTLNYDQANFANLPYSGNVATLTPYLSATVGIMSGSKYVLVPYTDHRNGSSTYISSSPQSLTGLSQGSQGQVVLTLTKDVIGGAIVIPPGIKLAHYYRSTAAGFFSDKPMTEIRTLGQVIPVTPDCTINNGQVINVDFNDIDASQLKTDGPSSTIKKSIPLTFSCSSSMTLDIKIHLLANSASFDAGAIGSSLPNVGVVMMHDDQPVVPYGYFDSKLVDGAGSETITFSPVISPGAENVQGNFTASATLVMDSA